MIIFFNYYGAAARLAKTNNVATPLFVASEAPRVPAGVMKIDVSHLAPFGSWSMQGGYEHDCIGAPMELFVNGG